ncbi:MAG TPA: hypothetical protein VK936_14870 [Longimicrobiales bacterium]|nr:hypothetical protein [Longimicrobiales bacterium]
MTQAARGATIIVVALLTVAAAACGARTGGRSGNGYQVATFRAASGASAQDVAARITGARADIVLLSAERDSAWFSAVSEGAGLELSGPGLTGDIGMAFLTNLEVLGDTSLVLSVPEGGSVHMHDALYRVDRSRMIDLMIVRFDAPDLRAAVRRLFSYIATDVGASVAVLLAIDAPTVQLADSAAVLMRAHYGNALECAGDDIGAGERGPVRLLYGPSARLSCISARALPGDPPGVTAGVILQR